MTDEEKEKNLLPCPFCGGEAKTVWIPIEMSLPDITVGGYAISCQTCFCVSLRGSATGEEAISHWNKREVGRVKGGKIDKSREG